MAKVKFEDLLRTGAHFGHVTRKWNPNFRPFILSEKNGVHIINLDSTIQAIEKAGDFIKKVGDALNMNQNNEYRLEVVSLKDSKTAEPIIVELNITKL